MSNSAVAQTIRRLSWVDVALIGPMAIPGVSHLIIDLILWLDAVLGLDSAVQSMTPMGMLFMNVVGVLAISWCVVRIRAPSVLLGWVDVIARLAVSVLILLYIIFWGITPVVLLFLASEMIGATLEWRVLKQV